MTDRQTDIPHLNVMLRAAQMTRTTRTITINTTRYVGKFYGSFNNILNVLGKRRNDMLAVHLIKTYCLPMLLYSCEIWAARPVDMRSVDVR